MATYEPPLDLLARQLDSIRAQTHRNWVCVISDDCSGPERFARDRRRGRRRPALRASRARRGGSASTATSSARWRWPRPTPSTSRSPTRTTSGTPTSSRRCSARSATRSSSTATRGSSSADGALISDTYWEPARATTTPTCSRCWSRTRVTGAASLFPRDAARRRAAVPAGAVRPLPRPLARADGALARRHRVRRPAALRLRPARRRDARPRRGQPACRRCASGCGAAAARPARARAGCGGCTTSSTSAGCCSSPTILRAALRRADGARQAPRARALRSAPTARSPALGAAVRARRARARSAGRETLGAEWMLAYALRLAAAARRDRRASAPQPRLRARRAAAARPRRRGPGAPRARRAAGARSPRRSRRSSWRSATTRRARVNLLDPDDRPASTSSAATSRKFNLARRLAARGAAGADRHRRPGRRRCRATGARRSRPTAAWRACSTRSRSRSAASRRRSRSAATTASSRPPGGPPTSPRDAVRPLERERFLYLIQEYEPFTFPMGTLRRAGRRVLPLPALRAVLDRAAARLLPPPRHRRLRRRARGGRRASAVVPERDHGGRPADRGRAAPARHARRLLFYARPEPHAARNMFELGLLALGRARRARARSRATGSSTASARVDGAAAPRPRRRRDARAAPALRPGRLRATCCATTTSGSRSCTRRTRASCRSRWPRPGCSP